MAISHFLGSDRENDIKSGAGTPRPSFASPPFFFSLVYQTRASGFAHG